MGIPDIRKQFRTIRREAINDLNTSARVLSIRQGDIVRREVPPLRLSHPLAPLPERRGKGIETRGDDEPRVRHTRPTAAVSGDGNHRKEGEMWVYGDLVRNAR